MHMRPCDLCVQSDNGLWLIPDECVSVAVKVISGLSRLLGCQSSMILQGS
jgi:hypothetical protein